MKNQTIYIIIGLIVLLSIYFIMRKTLKGLTSNFRLRGCDKLGCGHFKAPRKHHKGVKWHMGLDIRAKVGEAIHAPFDLKFVRVANPYNEPNKPDRMTGGKYSFDDGTMKIFYMKPILTSSISRGKTFLQGEIIGFAQNISAKYSYGKNKMINHIHLEMRNNENVLLNPENYV